MKILLKVRGKIINCSVLARANKSEEYWGIRNAVHAPFTHTQQVSTDKNNSFKNIRVGHWCLLSPTYTAIVTIGINCALGKTTGMHKIAINDTPQVKQIEYRNKRHIRVLYDGFKLSSGWILKPEGLSALIQQGPISRTDLSLVLGLSLRLWS